MAKMLMAIRELSTVTNSREGIEPKDVQKKTLNRQNMYWWAHVILTLFLFI